MSSSTNIPSPVSVTIFIMAIRLLAIYLVKLIILEAILLKRLFIFMVLLLTLFTKDRHQVPTINILDFGANPNNSKDDTKAIQEAIDYAAKVGGIVHFPKGVFLINADPNTGSLWLHNNQEIKMDKETILKVIPNSLSNYVLFYIYDKHNVKISGGNLKGDRYEHQSDLGEYGHGISINGQSKNIDISDIHISDFWGDGFYIGGNEKRGTYPSNIKIKNSTSDNNRRQGLSITAGKNITIQESTFSNTNGTAPEAGIDLERNAPYQLPLEKITLSNNKIVNNNGYGLMVVYTNNNTAESNQIKQNKKGGIYIGGEADNVKTSKNKIVNNTIFENGGNSSTELNGNGIFLNFAPNNTLSKNTIFRNKKNGVELLNRVGENIINKNIIMENNEAGIEIWGGSDNNSGIIIQENVIESNLKDGLSLSNAVTAKIIKNRFIRNGDFDIYLENVSGYKLQSNQTSANSIKIRKSTKKD